MNIIIDSNIFNRDLKLKDRNFDIISDYLSRTNSDIVIPQIVLEEIKNLYKKALQNNFNTYAGSVVKLAATFISAPTAYKKITVDFDAESDKYIEFIIKKLNISPDKIINYKNEYLTELVYRAINRIKPLGENGQQFRDGLLWLTILDYAETTENREVIFISANSTDFAEKNSKSLYRDLVAECKSRDVTVHYYTSTEDFTVGIRASVVNFINEDWINKNVDLDKIDKIFSSTLESIDDDYVKDSVELDHNERLTGDINRTSYISSQILSHYVYEKLNGEILLKLEVQFETEYELEIERTIGRNEPRYDHSVVINPLDGSEEWITDYVLDYVKEQEQDFVQEYPLYIGNFTLTIQNEEITEIVLTDWDRG